MDRVYGGIVSGHQHDYAILKTEFLPEQPSFETLHALLDMGYQGSLTNYVDEKIALPHEKPRKSQKKPQPRNSPIKGFNFKRKLFNIYI